MSRKVLSLLIFIFLSGCSVAEGQEFETTDADTSTLTLLDAVEIAENVEKEQERIKDDSGKAIQPFITRAQLMTYGQAVDGRVTNEQTSSSDLSQLVWLITMKGEWKDAYTPKSTETLPTTRYIKIIINATSGDIEGFIALMDEDFAGDIYLNDGDENVEPCNDIVIDEKLQIITYLVKKDDSLFSIADKFGLNPETILWANEEILSDNPNNIEPGMELIILPVDGIYYKWELGDTLDDVAKRFSASPAEILNWQGNDFCGLQFKDNLEPDIPEGTYIIIPNGKRFSD